MKFLLKVYYILVMPTPPDDGEVIGPVSAEVLMEESENDSNISSILPTFPVRRMHAFV